MRSLVVGIGVLIAGAAGAGKIEQPFVGLLHGNVDKDFMIFDCGLAVEGRMACKFTQVSISKKGKPSDLQKSLKDIPKFIAEMSAPKGRADCAEMAALREGYRSGKRPAGVSEKNFAEVVQMDPRAKQDALKTLDAFMEACSDPTEDKVAQLMRLTHERNERTCRLRVNPFEQTFVLSGKGWVHNNGPTGTCGVIYVTKLEMEDEKALFWRYSTRKIVANRNDDSVLPGLCQGLDETEHTIR